VPSGLLCAKWPGSPVPSGDRQGLIVRGRPGPARGCSRPVSPGSRTCPPDVTLCQLGDRAMDPPNPPRLNRVRRCPRRRQVRPWSGKCTPPARVRLEEPRPGVPHPWLWICHRPRCSNPGASSSGSRATPHTTRVRSPDQPGSPKQGTGTRPMKVCRDRVQRVVPVAISSFVVKTS